MQKRLWLGSVEVMDGVLGSDRAEFDEGCDRQTDRHEMGDRMRIDEKGWPNPSFDLER